MLLTPNVVFNVSLSKERPVIRSILKSASWNQYYLISFLGTWRARLSALSECFWMISNCVVWFTCWREEMLDRQKDLKSLERWFCKKAKCKVLQLDQGNPKYGCRLCSKCIESSTIKKMWGLLVYEKLNLSLSLCLLPRQPTASWVASKSK